MALDIYVGPLVRYYSGDWETVIQRWSRETGTPLTVIRASGDTSPLPSVDELRNVIEEWQAYLNRGLAGHLKEPIAWVEDATAPYFTDRPGHDAFTALVLWAAYAEQPSLNVAKQVPSDYGKDPAFMASNAEGFRSRYGQLLHEVEIWLPASFPFTFRGAHLGEGDIGLGSTHTLLEELHELNEQTWRLTESDLPTLLAEGVDKGAPLETAARFGYSVVEKLAKAAVEVSLPMRLDY